MNLFLTRAFVDYELAFKRGLRDAYRWHQAVWEAFPGRDGQARNFLTRLDVRDRGFQLLILSSVSPCKPGWSPSDTWETKPINEDFFNRDRYGFQLRANPTKKVRVEDDNGSRKKNGRRIPLAQREELTDWLARKALAGGFCVEQETVKVHPARKELFWKTRDSRESKLMLGVLQGIEFRGTLKVSDRCRFLETFRSGIGSAKAFGFGLLLLAPLSSAD